MRSSYEYNGYNASNSKYVNSYRKRHYKTLSLNMALSYYDNTLSPYVKANNDTVAGFIKKAIQYYIDNADLVKPKTDTQD